MNSVTMRSISRLGLSLAVFCAALAARGQDDDSPSVPDVVAEAPAPRIGAIIPIHGELTDLTEENVARRIDIARERGATVIVFELDTPGGLVTSSIAIADLIKNLPDEITSVAWVNTNAHSGGSIVAVACDEMVMAKSSRIGDSQVIFGTPMGAEGIPDDLKAKANTPVLAEFRASAKRNGYSRIMCEAFVLPEREVWWLEHIDTGEREFVFREEKLDRLGDAGVFGDESAESGEWKLVKEYYDPVLDVDLEVHQPIVSDSELLEMSAGEAQAYGFSKGVVQDQDELRARYALSDVSVIEPTWSEGLAGWMTSMYVRGFLLVLILLGAYVEFHTPGVGVPGLVALICLGIFIAAPYSAGLANVWEILLIAIGFGLIALEVFVIPGFGVAGVSGIVLLLFGLVATFAPDDPGRSFPLYIPSFQGTIDGMIGGLKTVSASIMLSLVGMIGLSRVLPKMSIFEKFAPENVGPGPVEDPYAGAARVGDLGICASELHPSGKARFGSMLVDVVTQGELIENGARVEVVERRGNRVVVRMIA